MSSITVIVQISFTASHPRDHFVGHHTINYLENGYKVSMQRFLGLGLTRLTFDWLMIYNGDHEPVISNALYIHIIRRNCCADSFYIIRFSQIQVTMEWGKY